MVIDEIQSEYTNFRMLLHTQNGMNQMMKTETKRGRKKASRIGETNVNKFGSKMEIIAYGGSSDVTVKFVDHGDTVKASYQRFKEGNVRSKYDRTVQGVGYIGEGKHQPNGKIYRTWNSMIYRCYNEKLHAKKPTYADCRVTEEWLNYQNFADWYTTNYYEIDGQSMHLDKDLLKRGNKMYSPKTCCIVPQSLNALIIGRDAKRGDLPIGVRYVSVNHKKYEALCNDNEGGRVFLGTFDCPIKAFNRFKEFKESLIKQQAEKYRENIPHALYNALINFTVEITD